MKSLRLITIMLPIVFIGFVVSGVVHEVGHGIFILLFGGQIDYIQPFVFVGAPHISYSGVFTDGARALTLAGGALMAVFVGLLGLFMIPFKRLKPILSFSLAIVLLGFLSQSLAWIFLPIFNMFGFSLADDSTKFLQYSEWHPLIVSIAWIAIFTFSMVIFLKKTSFFSLVKQFKQDKPLKCVENYCCKKDGNKRFLPSFYAFALWGVLIFSITFFAMGNYFSWFGSQWQDTASVGVATMEQDFTLTYFTVAEESEKEENLSFRYTFAADEGEFSLVVIAPNGNIEWEESWSGHGMSFSSAGDINVPLPYSGQWMIKLRGAGENVMVDMSWSVRGES